MSENMSSDMKITLLAVGKTSKGWIADALGIYAGRLSHYVNFSIVELPELKNAGAMAPAQIKTREGASILSALRPDDHVILLDEHGAQHGSVEFSKELQKLLSAGRNIVFVVGGSYGFCKEVYDRADSMLSLSRMTFSHQMVRVFFAEQLYRAFTIIKGEPYHNE